MDFYKKLSNRGTVLVAPLMGLPGIQLTKTTIKENLENAEIQFQTIKKLKGKFNPDIVFPLMDLSVEAEALGLKIKNQTTNLSLLKSIPLKT